MALFSLLVAILVERLKVLPASLQFDHLLQRYHNLLFRDDSRVSGAKMAVALVLPAVIVYMLGWLVAGLFWGVLSLALWVIIAVLCFSHHQQRQAFKRYVQAACRGDLQACFHYAAQMDPTEDEQPDCHQELACRVGQSVAWINYRYYGAIALYFIFAGPVGAVLYCTVRFYGESNCRNQIKLPLVDTLLLVLDWLPARLFAFGYALCGEFRRAIEMWRKQSFSVKTPARDIIVNTAMAAEPMACEQSSELSLQPTIAMLALSKRNFILLVTLLSLLTIFGVVN